MAGTQDARDKKTVQKEADELRRGAEERIDKLSAAAAAAAAAAASPSLPVSEDLAAAVHELRVHQIELEMQNEELRRVQLELDAERDKYVDLFEAAPVGYLTLSETGIIGNANFTAVYLLGVERGLLVGQPLSAFVFAPDRDPFHLHMRAIQRTEESQAFDLRLQRIGRETRSDAPPEPFWARLDAQPRRSAGGESPDLWVTFTDVTEHIRDERALEESEARFRMGIEVSPVPLAINDELQHITYVNPAFVQTFGYTLDEIPTLAHWWPLAYPDPRYRQGVAEAWQAEGERARRNGAAFAPMEVDVTCKDGTIRTVLASAAPFSGPQGSNDLVVLYDITERKQTETEVRRLNNELEDRVLARTTELRAANRELEAFVYSASHDLRAPLRTIDGFSQMVIEDAAERLDATDSANLQRVRAAAQRMALLIDGLLVLSRAGRKDVLRTNVDVSAMAGSVIADLCGEHPERRVEVAIQPDLTADADATLLHVILTNLLGNAWKFTSKHETARIEVGVTDAGGERAYFVKDDGAGFDMVAAQHLFGAFQRLHSTNEFEGDGIGLATVQRLVARHGGRVWAEAEVEKGATFFFTLPEGQSEG